MGADDDIDCAFAQRCDDGPLLALRAEAGEHLDAHREAGQPFAKGGEVLLGEHGGGHQHGHLGSAHHRLERGPERDFGLAVADIAADEAVHRARPLHILFHRPNGGQLVGGLDIGERCLQLLLPRRIGRKRTAFRDLASSVELQQLLRQLRHRATDPGFRPAPLLTAQAGEAWFVFARAGVTADPVDLLRRHVEAVAVGVAQLQVLPLDITDTALDEASEASDPVFDVDDVVAGGELGQERLRRQRGGGSPRKTAALLHEAEDLGVGEQRQRWLRGRQPPAVRQRARDEGDDARLRRGRLGGEGGGHALLLQHLRQPLRLLRDDDQRSASSGGLGCGGGQVAQAAAVGVGRRERQPARCTSERRRGVAALVRGRLDRPAREMEPPGLLVELRSQLFPGRVGRRKAGGQLAPRLQVLTHLLGLGVVLLQRLR